LVLRDARAGVMTNARHQISFPRAWASLTPPTCAVLDGRAPELEQMGQPGRPLSRSRGSCAQNSVGIERENISRGVSSCVHTTKRKFRPLRKYSARLCRVMHKCASPISVGRGRGCFQANRPRNWPPALAAQFEQRNTNSAASGIHPRNQSKPLLILSFRDGGRA
jgi:hypothetical protein